MAQDAPDEREPHLTGRPARSLRVLSTVLILLLVGGYTGALVTGRISSTDRLDATDLVLIAIAAVAVVALTRPDTFRQIKLFELGNVKLELREIKEVQGDQQSGLDGVRMVMSIVLPEPERDHLTNLESGRTRYTGRFTMRSELRHLRSLALIRMCPGHTVEEMRTGMIFDLSDYVQLTELGRRSAQMIRKAAAPDDDQEPGARE